METRLRSGFWLFFAVLLFIGLFGHLVSAQTRTPKNVQVALRAKWSGTPLLLEAGYVIDTRIVIFFGKGCCFSVGFSFYFIGNVIKSFFWCVMHWYVDFLGFSDVLLVVLLWYVDPKFIFKIVKLIVTLCCSYRGFKSLEAKTKGELSAFDYFCVVNFEMLLKSYLFFPGGGSLCFIVNKWF